MKKADEIPVLTHKRNEKDNLETKGLEIVFSRSFVWHIKQQLWNTHCKTFLENKPHVKLGLHFL